MPDDRDVPAEPPADREPPPPSAAPFVAALVVVAVLGTLAFVFLRADDEGELVRPDRIVALDDDTVQASALDQPPCRRIERAQVDLDDRRVFVELVAVEVEGCDDTAPVDLVARIDLPEPVGERRLVAGVGRTRLPCLGEGSAVTCAPAP